MNRYPRDMHGYGRIPPKANWPGGARIALQVVVNYEEGGENCVLHGDDQSEAFLSEIIGADPWPNQRHMNMESIYEYGARAGFWRLYRLLTYMQIPVTVFGVATALARSPEQVTAMREARWEIASHGLKWIDYRDFYPEDERDHMMEAIKIHTEVTGERPLGWYTGRSSENTLKLMSEEGGFAYCADSYADDLPYWETVDNRNQLIVPYTLDANDMRFATNQGFNTGDQFETYLKDSFDCLYAEGAAGRPKMMSIGLHCRLAGRPGRIMGLKRFLDYVRTHDHVWYARRIDIARHWTHTHPTQAQRVRPSRMDFGAFMDKFGGVYEHSPWIVERAHGMEMGPAHDSAAGVHALLSQVFRRATEEERYTVLRAHPDLAGKLAAARALTTDSTAEQASAGLDALTAEERRAFEKLNADYTAKFTFPFIIAVRDHDKAGILRAFQARLQNDKDQEFSEACRQVERIAELRLHAMDI
ncbi:allantoinase PuuE [Actibacterium sp. 188UL27-1]|uniref:allantoinase PuuE n=1 Tax=Actibacterium sp. 188UL27-1 TaxID=2786961 RepID=UPI001959C935|nr:allantoinase PuuE [Actibacterium sp. 188UL27-1]MBM7068381.1 allantoinase PuuE [Actibacterium sp. 188UL27-1]